MVLELNNVLDCLDLAFFEHPTVLLVLCTWDFKVFLRYRVKDIFTTMLLD